MSMRYYKVCTTYVRQVLSALTGQPFICISFISYHRRLSMVYGGCGHRVNDDKEACTIACETSKYLHYSFRTLPKCTPRVYTTALLTAVARKNLSANFLAMLIASKVMTLQILGVTIVAVGVVGNHNRSAMSAMLFCCWSSTDT